MQFFLTFYKKTISSAFVFFFGAGCVYRPTCSQYTLEAVGKYGVVKGVLLGLKRLFRCHPWAKVAWDPVSDKPKS